MCRICSMFVLSIVLFVGGCATAPQGPPIDLSTVPESAEATSPLEAGQAAPLKTLRTPDGAALDLSAAARMQPMVLIFYRGGWCPYCNRHLAEVQTIESKLRDLGFGIYAVSPDRPEKLQASVKDQKLNYALLSDSSMEMAHAFGLAFKLDQPTLKKYKEYGIDLKDASGKEHHLLPVPAVFIVDTSGIIRFSYADPDYKKRLEPEKILEAARLVHEP